MYIKKFWNQGLLFKGMGFATTACLQVAHACSSVVHADKSGQQCCHPTTEDVMRVNELCSVTSGKTEDEHI
jgi:hypothetical protein